MTFDNASEIQNDLGPRIVQFLEDEFDAGNPVDESTIITKVASEFDLTEDDAAVAIELTRLRGFLPLDDPRREQADALPDAASGNAVRPHGLQPPDRASGLE